MDREPLHRGSLPLSAPKGRRPLDERDAHFYLLAFVFLQMAAQVVLFLGAPGGLRVVFRCAAFGASLGMLFLVQGKGRPHPARGWALAVLAIVALNLLHPTSNTLAACLAQVGLYGAILGPLLWVVRLPVTTGVLRRILLVFWGFHAVSTAVAVLQVYFPGRFQPAVTVTIREEMLESLKITLASGEQVFRPMGLTDVPGGVATSGFYVVLSGLGFLLISRSWPMRTAAALGIGMGLFCIYLSQSRYILIMSGVCVLTLIAVLLRRGELTRLVALTTVAAAVVAASSLWAVAVGGASVTNRFASLVNEPAGEVYYKNRGYFLEDTVNRLLPLYPLGAGLGRWGMTSFYFGDDNHPDSHTMWVEIQWTGWLYDGGLPLITCYVLALGTACAATWRIATSRLPDELPTLAALVLAYDVGCLAVTFNSPVFLSQTGMEFWLLNTVTFVAACSARRQPAVPTRDLPR
jgi:hypothetical protein